MPGEEQLLAEALAAGGYTTARFVENDVALRPNALQGFPAEPKSGIPDARRFEIEQRLGVDASDPRWRRLLGVLDFLLDPPAGPFFVLEWMIDPHTPYHPPAALRADLPAPGARLGHPLEYYMRLMIKPIGKRAIGDVLDRVVVDMNASEKSLLHELYLREVSSVDRRVGAMLKALDRSGRLETTRDAGSARATPRWQVNTRARGDEREVERARRETGELLVELGYAE